MLKYNIFLHYICKKIFLDSKMELKNAIFLRIKSYLLSNDALDRLKLKHFSPKSTFKELNFLPLRATRKIERVLENGFENLKIFHKFFFTLTFEVNKFSLQNLTTAGVLQLHNCHLQCYKLCSNKYRF